MIRVQNLGVKFIIMFFMLLGFSSTLFASSCSNKLFSVTIDSKLSIGDVIENLADTCNLTVIVTDDAAKKRMNKKLYYVKLKNSTLKGFLNTILKDHDLYYTLTGNKLKISYLITRTFRIHYISGQRIGKSNANVTIANSSRSSTGGSSRGGSDMGGAGGGEYSQSGSKTGISIESNDEFKFWKTVETEIQRILIGAADGSTHYAKTGGGWTGPDCRVWEYNPLAPIVNPEAGMVTVTGTSKQINRVARYVHTMSKQIKQQVLIDVRILSVSFDDSSTTGVDWSQLYALQNFTINSLAISQKNISGFSFEDASKVAGSILGADQAGMQRGKAVSLTGSTKVSEVIKFLNTQGDVKAISSPRVMTLNNQPALISVGKELFYKIKSTSALGTGNNANTAEGETIDSVFAGILLDITPEIDSKGMITLKINPSISDTVDELDKTSDVARSIPPDLLRRQIASVIKVRDGEHAILGGLIFSRTGTKVNKVPLLGDLPLLEYAFKHEEKINKIEELVMIVTPHIVKTSKSVSLKDLGYSKVNEK
jgi:general secretion pathway protein D